MRHHASNLIEENVRPLQRRVRVCRPVIERHGVSVRLQTADEVPLLPVHTEEMSADSATPALSMLRGIICMVDDVPVFACVNPHKGGGGGGGGGRDVSVTEQRNDI